MQIYVHIVPENQEMGKLSEQINKKPGRRCKQVARLSVTYAKCGALMPFGSARKMNRCCGISLKRNIPPKWCKYKEKFQFAKKFGSGIKNKQHITY